MTSLAPNLSAIVGTSIAAQLIGAAGGLPLLSRLPSSNLQALGTKKKSLSGFSSASGVRHTGFINESDIVAKTPFSYRRQVCRFLGSKCALAARVDSFHESIDGAVGRELRQEVEKKIEKLQEPPPPKQEKPLPAPDDKIRKRRGGKRYRKAKQKYGLTELRKYANRMVFGEQEETYQNTERGFGMLGNSGKVRIQANTRKINRKVKAFGGGTRTSGGLSTTSGLSSSLAFTPVQGLELENPQAAAAKVAEANKKYFGNTTFLKVSSSSSSTS